MRRARTESAKQRSNNISVETLDKVGGGFWGETDSWGDDTPGGGEHTSNPYSEPYRPQPSYDLWSDDGPGWIDGEYYG